MGNTSKILIGLVVLAIIGLGIYFYSKNYSTSSTTSTSSTSVLSNSVSIKDMAFSPSNITVKVGDTVTWTNNDSAQHQIVSDSGSAVSINSSRLSNGSTFAFTFSQAGTYTYHCSIHPSMTGKIIVQ